MAIIAECSRPAEILLIDDNLGDAKLLEFAFKNTALRVNITVALTAEIGMSLLRGGRAPHTPPDLVFLDLNLPTMHGLTFLRLMKDDPDLIAIPVLVISSSSAEKDITESYRHHASGFVTKPFDLAGYAAFAREITAYWFNLVQLPRGARA